MKTLLIFAAACFLITGEVFSQQSHGWRGIVPLRSTRADVERLLGSSTDACQCVYKPPSETVRVEYSRGGCSETAATWNVQPGTVISFTVTPKTWQRFADIVDAAAYERTIESDNPTTHYTNKEKGVRYTVTEQGMIYYVTYSPSTKDAHLKCNKNLEPRKENNRYRPFDFYRAIDFRAEKARLDNFAAWLQLHPELNGYILTYTTRSMGARAAKARANRAKRYLIRTRHIDSKRVITIFGGYRRQAETELYALPAGTSLSE